MQGKVGLVALIVVIAFGIVRDVIMPTLLWPGLFYSGIHQARVCWYEKRGKVLLLWS